MGSGAGTHSGLFQAVQQMVVLAFNERGCLSYLLLFWGTLEGEGETEFRAMASCHSYFFISSQRSAQISGYDFCSVC